MFSAEWIRNNPKRYDEIVRRASERWAPIAGAAVRAQAVMLAPWQTGNLRGSITWKTKKEDGGFNSGPNASHQTGTMIDGPDDPFSAHVGSNVDYAAHIEYGTKYIKHRETVAGFVGYKPYLRPALDLMRKRLNDMLKRIFGEEARRG